MTLLKRFLLAINSLGNPASALAGRESELTHLNPDKFYVENVRSLLGVSNLAAVRICETAVRQGTFLRGVEILAPDDVLVASAATDDELPPVIRCWEQHDGELEETEYATSALKKITFYRLVDDESTSLFR